METNKATSLRRNESEYSPRTCSIGRPAGGTLCPPPLISHRHHEDGDVLAVCVDFIFPGFGTTYIVVFEHNEGAKNLAQNPVCTSNSKYIDVRTPVLRELIFPGRYSVIRV